MPRGPLKTADFARELDKQLKLTDHSRLLEWILEHLPWYIGPSITSFSPLAGQPGTLVTICGHQFSTVREDNAVVVGGRPAFVVSATPTELRVITDSDVITGPVKVTVGGRTAAGPVDFMVLGYPNAGAGEDGPPISFEGAGTGAQGDVNPIGTVRILVSLVRPSDRAVGAGERAAVVAAWNKVRTFYTQASYGRTDVQVDITTNWAALDGTEADFLNDEGDNFDWGQIDRLTAQAAQHAVNEGFDLDNYAMMATVCSVGVFVRAWGGWSRQNFSYSNPSATPAININLSADHEVNLIAISQDANWGRCAHEFGHNVVSAPSFTGDGTATLGEDVYASDLVDPNAATAREFEMMGSHDLHPLFSGYHLEKLGYYTAANIQTLDWNRNPFSQEFDVVAHGLSEDTTGRVHLVKIKVANGLFYYVQVRQRPGTTTQIFDENIPLGGASNQGGVIVTRVVSDTLNINQQTRFITLMHDPEVLSANDFVEDPARALRITVVNDAVQARPLVCRVRVEWAQTIVDDPNGSFDLSVEPWGANWQTPDIWVDRQPFGTFDQPLDSAGRPQGNGDKPRPNEINHLKGRIHVSGAMGAADVKATFYAVFPPGVGDNGNWAPVGVQNIAAIAQNSFVDIEQNWVPVVGQHTCLKLYASAQLGEISGGNNFAQENVFDFEAPASSPPDPVTIPTAIRNPLDERACVRIGVKGVPFGWRVHFPHAWVWLGPKEEKHFDLVVVPMLDGSVYLAGGDRPKDRKVERTAPINIEGIVPRSYDSPLAPAHQPAGSRAYPIGGLLGRVHVRRRVDIKIEERRRKEDERVIQIQGAIKPALDKQRIRAVCIDPDGRKRIVQTFTAADGSFDAAFDLRFEPSDDPRKKVPAKKILAGIYEMQAFVVAASLAAEAESNRLYIARK